VNPLLLPQVGMFYRVVIMALSFLRLAIQVLVLFISEALAIFVGLILLSLIRLDTLFRLLISDLSL
jgi:hypothetical protein